MNSGLNSKMAFHMTTRPMSDRRRWRQSVDLKLTG